MLTFGESLADRYVTTLFYVSGLWFDAKPSILYRIHSFFVLFVLMAPWILCLDIGLALSDNLKEATHALITAVPVTVFFAKAMNLLVNNEMIQSCLRRVHNFSLLGTDEKELANNRMRFFLKFTVFYVLMCNVTITYICWRVAFLEKAELPFGSWYPLLDWQHNNRHFWIVQTYQFYGMVIAVNMNLACELLPCFFLTAIGCQLEILGMRLQKLNSEECVHGKENSEMIEKLIDDHIETHYYIITLTEDFQKSYNFPFFVEICTVGITNTANAFQLVSLAARHRMGEHVTFEYLNYITQILCTIFRIFLPCYFGNVVLSASEALRFRLYSSEWLDMSIPCRKKMITIMERLKRPTVIWAWVLFPLTLEIFKSITNFSYTMLTLLQNFN